MVRPMFLRGTRRLSASSGAIAGAILGALFPAVVLWAFGHDLSTRGDGLGMAVMVGGFGCVAGMILGSLSD